MSLRPNSLIVVFVGMSAACSAPQEFELDHRHGPERVQGREVAALATGEVDYQSQVRPILEARCVVCHACYDAPCQLKLGSFAGIDRGASVDKVYDASRLLQAEPTRLFEDAQTTAAWREKRFHPVLNERAQTREANRESGVMVRLLELKRSHPVAPGTLIPDDVDLRLRHDESCPTAAELGHHARKHPDWGMPYGLPGLSADEHDIVTRWLDEGARQVTPAVPPRPLGDPIGPWEALLNQDSLRARLASRYIYEHLFLAHLYFAATEDGAVPEFFELVRSTTPPGQPIARIATRRPYDDPGVLRPYYRLQPVREAIVAKLHLPYRLDAERMTRWRALFYDADYAVTELPSYTAEVASNPFIAFQAIPVPSRYRFMLDEAEFTIMGFIKGAVCRGPIALNVIDDQFWVFFVDPDARTQLHDAGFLLRHADSLRMPAEASSDAPPLVTWLRESQRELAYARAKQQAIREDLRAGQAIDLDTLWDGDGSNRNAALTIFRHFDSASVVKGMVGAPPKTAWVVGYPLLERIHYLLVAGFDVYGNIGHQAATRAYMDFLRMEAEFMFLAFLPANARQGERSYWYRDTNEHTYRHLVAELASMDAETAIPYSTERPKLELYRNLRSYLAPVLDSRFELDDPRIPEDVAAALRALAAVKGAALEWAPQTAFLYLPDGPVGAQVFTILRNDGHTNIASPFDESDRRAPLEDTLTVASGFIGTYPNAFYVVERARLAEFVQQFAGLRSETHYGVLQAGFGVRRTDTDFWSTSDRLVQLFRQSWPVEAGIFDLSRYENR